MKGTEKELCTLLEEAADFLKQIPDGGLSSFDSGPQMAAFVTQCKEAIEQGTTTPTQRRKLWVAFAPTCDWDDIGGGPDLGNKIFSLLESLYGDEAKNVQK